MAFKVTYNGKDRYFEQPISVLQIVGKDRNIVCSHVNGRIRELTYLIAKDSVVEAVTCKDRDAKPCYEASLRYLIAMAMHNIYPEYNVRFTYNISRSVYMEISNKDVSFSPSMLEKLNQEMKRIVDLDLPLVRKIVSVDEAKRVFTEWDYKDKVEILNYRPEVTAHYYECDGYINYMFNRMVPSTGYLSRYALRLYHPGVIIQYPRPDCDGEIPCFEEATTFGRTIQYASQWASLSNTESITSINKMVKNNGEIDVISICEARHNNQLSELGSIIQERIENVRLICIAGPSSSGKTTFANRLRVELLSRGIKPIRISLDDYYLPREKIPLDENGNYDFESIDALDINLFNNVLSNLIAGNEVSLPYFDFIDKKRKEGKKVKLGKKQPIIIEGIHALNKRMTESVPSTQKFKIFISPQVQMNIDDHNPLSLTDLRLIRRIVRDNQFRSCAATETLAMWPSVRKGEFKWIYSMQEYADYVFNSFLPYELCLMKKYAMPLLEVIDTESVYFPVAERLLRMLKFFVDIDDKWVPCNSLVREFIGGSCYKDV